MSRVWLVALVVLLLSPGIAAPQSAPARGPLAGLHEWDAGQAEARRLLRELKTDPVRAKAAERLEREWQALDQALQKVRALQAQGRLDQKTARTSADTLSAQMRHLESAAEDVKAKRDETKAQFAAADQKTTQLMQTLTQVVKTIPELRQIGGKSLP